MQKRKLKFIPLTILGFSFLYATSGWAATPLNLRHQPTTALQATVTATPTDFKEISSSVDANQTTHVRVQQMYQNYKVWGGDAVIHVPHGGALNSTQALLATKKNGVKVNGTIYQGLAKDLVNTPPYVFNAAQADKALQTATQQFQKNSGTQNTITHPKTELMVYVDDTDNKAHWAFLVSFLAKPSIGMPAKPSYIMDATTFKIYQQWNDIKTLDETSGGGFGGNQKMGKLIYDSLGNDLPKLSIERDSASNNCFLENPDIIVKDRRKNDAIVQFNCPKPDAEHHIFWDADQDFVNGGFSPSNDAMYAGKVIKEMYQQWYNVPVLENLDHTPMLLIMRVHDQDPDNVENAYWDGEEMTFGDGKNNFYPLVSLGVAAHEVSHGFTEQHSNLLYLGQAGGLDESFSDMAAQTAEFYSTGHSSWQIGAEIIKAPNAALRYMDEPTKDCHGNKPGNGCSISNVKDYHFGVDVHYSSGVFNKFFYLLSTAPGWDTKKAFGVMILANANYWTMLESFGEAACDILDATQDSGLDTTAVKQAAVGVGINTSTC